jgi:hypothetical protein
VCIKNWLPSVHGQGETSLHSDSPSRREIYFILLCSLKSRGGAEGGQDSCVVFPEVHPSTSLWGPVFNRNQGRAEIYRDGNLSSKAPKPGRISLD